MEALTLREADPQGHDALALLHEAGVEARALYPEFFAGSQTPPSNPPLPHRGIYVVGYLGAEPVGCGAIWPIDASSGEVRRMYVRRHHRRRGIAGAVLAHLIGRAQRLGYSHLVLETGNRQVAAMAFYERNGFKRTEPFGRHVDDPTSVCYARSIVGRGRVEPHGRIDGHVG